MRAPSLSHACRRQKKAGLRSRHAPRAPEVERRGERWALAERGDEDNEIGAISGQLFGGGGDEHEPLLQLAAVGCWRGGEGQRRTSTVVAHGGW